MFGSPINIGELHFIEHESADLKPSQSVEKYPSIAGPN